MKKFIKIFSWISRVKFNKIIYYKIKSKFYHKRKKNSFLKNYINNLIDIIEK